jgi:hypothetical protein
MRKVALKTCAAREDSGWEHGRTGKKVWFRCVRVRGHRGKHRTKNGTRW